MKRLTTLSLILFIVLSALVQIGLLPDVGSAQYTAVPYGFQNNPAAVQIYDPAGDLPVDFTCIAANGYGQWMYGTDNGIPAAYLVGDSLSNISTGSSPRPNGIVGVSDFSNDQYKYEVKVAANLVGSVRYVWPNDTRSGFVIRGLNDSRGTQGTQINIALGGNLNPLPSRQIISGSPYSVTTVSNDVSNIYYYMGGWPPFTENEPIVQGVQEADWRDQWDIAMDAKYLYLVWEHYDGNYNGYELFVNAILLSDGSIAPSFPKWLNNRQNAQYDTSVSVGRGRRPTISCNVRNSPTVPTFEVAYLTETSRSPNGIDPYTPWNSRVRYYHTDPITTFDRVLLTGIVGDAHASSYSKPLHARILTSSSRQPLSYDTKEIFVIAGGLYSFQTGITTYSNALIVYRIENDINPLTINTTPHYVDGIEMTSHAPPLFSGGIPIIDEPIRAFCNPYDGQATTAIDEFHALYRMQRTDVSTPLLIVRGFNNGSGGTTDTRTPINRTSPDNGVNWTWLPDPGDQYVGAVNQAGIHVHWGYNSVHYYSRDIRAYDEPIEENTLLSYEGRIADGTSHGGTVGAALDPGRQFTIWTDPIFNSGCLFVASAALPPNWSNGRLKFTSNNSILSIGSGVSSDLGSTLTILPNFECWFGGTGQELSLKANSICNYYGIPGGQLSQNFVGPGIIRLTGSGITTTATMAGHSYPSTIPNAANLNVRGGATLRIPDEAQMLTDQGHINLVYEPNLWPLNDPATANPLASGRVNASGHVRLANSILTAHVPSLAAEIDLDGYKTSLCTGGGCSSLAYQFESSECLFWNDGPGSLNLLFDYTSLPARIIGGKLMGVSIKGTWIYQGTTIVDIKPFEVGNVVFDQIHDFGISLKMDQQANSSLHYHGINLHGNDFRTFANANSDGIVIYGLNAYDLSLVGRETQVEVSNNTFNTAVGLGGALDTNHVRSAIRFVRTSGGILSNSITGLGYANGVILEDNGDQQYTSTLVCNNVVTGCSYSNFTGSGISSSFWQGYSKMNKVSSCNRGFVSGFSDIPYLIFSNYYLCRGAGLFLSTYADVNLTGVSHSADHSTDYPAYDTIANNNRSSVDAAEIMMASHSNIWFTETSPALNIGKNNIVDNALGELFLSAPVTIGVSSINDNYWKHNGNSYQPSGTDAQFHNVTFSKTDPMATSYFSCPFASSVSCSGGFISTSPGKGDNSYHVLSVDTAECERLRTKTLAYLTDNYPKAYDTGRYYMQHCAALNGVWQEFTRMDAANQYRDTNTLRYLEYREWLKSVLYLNTDSDWYCADAASIIHSFQYIEGQGTDRNGELAVIRYIIERGTCPFLLDYLHTTFDLVRQRQREIWRDTVKIDTNIYKLDTTLPTLRKLHLEVLIGQQEHRSGGAATFDIAGLHATQNPFTKETEIAFELGDRELMQLKVYDALGRVVFDNGIGNVLEAGKRSFKIDAKAWASGVYYARLSTVRGLVRTVKLQHLQ